MNDMYDKNAMYLYSAEAAVVAELRSHKLSILMFEHAVKNIFKQQPSIKGIIGRTTLTSPMYTLRKRLGFEEIFRFPDDRRYYIFLSRKAERIC